jgi:hypothetical protein
MGKFAGFVMIVAGVGTAAYVYPLMGSGSDRAEKQASDVAAITTSGSIAKSDAANIRVQPAPGTAAASKAAPRIISAENPTGKPSLLSAAPMITGALAALPGSAPVTTQTTLPSAGSAPSAAQPTVGKPVDMPVPQPVKRVAAGNGNDEARASLTRDIQRELKRVGCYVGDADGTWNSDTRQAMKAFNDRVNATLPVEDPDHILKTLVQGHPGNACGKSCPAGQTAADGRCVPTAIIAQRPAPRKTTKTEQASLPLPVANAAPVVAPPAASVASAPTVSSWETRVTVAPTPSPVPVPGAIAAATVSSTLSNAPLINPPRPDLPPGRMAVGAPDAPNGPTNGGPTNGGPTIVQSAAKDDAARDLRTPRSAPKIVVRTKSRTANDDADKSAAAAAKAVIAGQPTPETDVTQRPKFAAISAAGSDTERPAAKPQRVERPDPPRQAERRPAPQRVVAYVPPPPPRYVGAYNPPPVYRERARFGPQIFRQFDASSR